MSYMVELPRCKCGKAATHEWRNRHNAINGRGCKTCMTRELKAFQAREEGDQ